MFRNYFKTAVRSLYKNKAHALINIAGLSIGMSVAILIGLWIWDELSFDTYHRNYDRIAAVMQQRTINGEIKTDKTIALPLEAEIRKSYGSDFKHIVITAWAGPHILTAGDKKLSFRGNYMGSEAPEMFSLNMLKGSRNGLQGPSSILISQSVATALFGDADPMGKLLQLDNKTGFTVAGVYEDLPENTTLHDMAFMAPWDYYVTTLPQQRFTDWSDRSLFMYVQLADNADMAKVSEKIRPVLLRNAGPAEVAFQPALLLQPMRKWHLYSTFANGVNTGGAIQYVWLFGIIGLFVLLLACINFMNLSTARSEKRAKEVGVRKAIGSDRLQLISQFYIESLLMAILAFGLSVLLVSMTLPFFNEIAGKKMTLPWNNAFFWLVNAGFVLFTSFIAGSYPALYLSSFKPVKVLKGTFKAGRLAAIPRQALVVLQFTVSVVLIIGTIIVFKQVQFAKNRPVGYSRDGLITIETTTDDLHDHFNAVRADLLASGQFAEVAESSSPVTGLNNNRSDVSWEGKDPAMTVDIANIRVTSGYCKTVGLQFIAGRDFSAAMATDSGGVILNEAAVKYMGLKEPVGQTITMNKRRLTVIGVVKDMVVSPYEQARQTIFYLDDDGFGYLDLRINPEVSAHDAIRTLSGVFKTYSPAVPFAYRFADEDYARKFRSEERTGTLAACFAGLAVFISCLGLFGMASFMAEQRIREIGVRKILGASVFNLWAQLSKDFIVLVLVALLIAIPVAWSFMHSWLQNYTYRSDIPWWIFAVTGSGALLMTILTVSYQGIKAALTNPVKSLRTE